MIPLRITAIVLFFAMCAVGQPQASKQNAARSDWKPAHLDEGQPNISGSWKESQNGGGIGAAYDFELGAPPEEHQITGGGGNIPEKLPDVVEGGKIPYQPWALAMRQENHRKNANPTKLEDLDSHSRCLQEGVPRENFLGGLRISQWRGFVMIADLSTTRIIPLDGRPHVSPRIKLWAGDSVGHWEGNTLVVDVTNISDSGWYDWGGNFHSSDLHLVERWTLVDANTISYEATNYDPKVFTRPWKIRNEFVRGLSAIPAESEDACYEGEKDIDVMFFHGKQ